MVRRVVRGIRRLDAIGANPDIGNVLPRLNFRPDGLELLWSYFSFHGSSVP